MDTYEVLTVILSITLTVFLIVGIVLLVLVIKIVNSVKRISSQAEKAVDNMADVAHMVRKTVKPAAISAGIAEFLKSMVGKKGGKRG